MQLTSSAFADGGKIPQQYVMPGAGGKNLSLPLAWSGAPAGTKSFALSIVDPHPVAHNWVHWLVADIPGGAASLPARVTPDDYVGNSADRTGFAGLEAAYLLKMRLHDDAEFQAFSKRYLEGYAQQIERVTLIEQSSGMAAGGS